LDEVGRLDKVAPRRIALAYPSPYRVGMSSLGYQQIYRTIQGLAETSCERFFLPDGEDAGTDGRALGYEFDRTLSEYPLIALSVAYELELAGVINLLDKSGIPARANERDGRHPLILAGGPLTFSNPIPLGALCDAVVMGEAEELVAPVLDAAFGATDRASALRALAALPHVWVPSLHGEALPSLGLASNALLPACSTILTPHTELSGMFLVEAERGCSRGCAYCVMRRSTNGGMRIIPKETVLARIPEGTRKVGLVGAAVSDHPAISDIVRTLADRGMEVGLSSLRPDKVRPELVEQLARVGYKTLTTALDGTSERMRGIVDRRGHEEHYRRAAQLVRESRLERLKLYLMIGVPTETEEDVDECIRFVGELSRICPVSLGVSPFCSKRNTPLDRQPYAGIQLVQSRLERLRRGLQGRAEVRATSAKWAWVEYVLAQGGLAEGHAVVEAVRAGGGFGDYRKAFGALGHRGDGTGYAEAVAPDPRRWVKS